MPYLVLVALGLAGTGLGYLKGRFDIFSGGIMAPSPSPVQTAFSSPFMLALTVILGLVGLSYFKNIKSLLKGVFK